MEKYLKDMCNKAKAYSDASSEAYKAYCTVKTRVKASDEDKSNFEAFNAICKAVDIFEVFVDAQAKAFTDLTEPDIRLLIHLGK